MRLRLCLAARQLREGKLLAYPTEAVWGLGCDPLNRRAVADLLALKGRTATKGLILIAADFGQIEAFLDIILGRNAQPAARQLAWPRNLDRPRRAEDSRMAAREAWHTGGEGHRASARLGAVPCFRWSHRLHQRQPSGARPARTHVKPGVISHALL